VSEMIYRGKSGGTKNAIRRRQVPLPASAVAMLEDWLRRAKFTGPQDLVFCAENGKPLSETNLASRQLRPIGRAGFRSRGACSAAPPLRRPRRTACRSLTECL
jgi:site-specific recombinase XerD